MPVEKPYTVLQGRMGGKRRYSVARYEGDSIYRVVKRGLTQAEAIRERDRLNAEQPRVNSHHRRQRKRVRRETVVQRLRRLARTPWPGGRRRRRHTAKAQRRRNPTLGILAANPRGPHIVKELSRRTYDVAYRHTEDGGPYKHSFGKGVHISLLSDGNVLLWHPTHSIWKRFA